MLFLSFIGCFLLTNLCICAVADKVDMNDIVDSILQEVSESLKESKTETIVVPDMEKRFKAGFIRGGVKATQGTFDDLSTVRRTEDVIMDVSQDGNSAVLTGSLGLGTMELNFGHARAWIGSLSVSDRLYVKVNKNSLQFRIFAQVGDSCVVKLEEVTFNQFGDLRVDLGRLHKVKALAENFISWIVNHFDKNIRLLVEYHLKEIIDKELSKYSKDICSFLM